MRPKYRNKHQIVDAYVCVCVCVVWDVTKQNTKSMKKKNKTATKYTNIITYIDTYIDFGSVRARASSSSLLIVCELMDSSNRNKNM